MIRRQKMPALINVHLGTLKYDALIIASLLKVELNTHQLDKYIRVIATRTPNIPISLLSQVFTAMETFYQKYPSSIPESATINEWLYNIFIHLLIILTTQDAKIIEKPNNEIDITL